MIYKKSITCRRKKYDSYHTYLPKLGCICMILSYIHASYGQVYEPKRKRAIKRATKITFTLRLNRKQDS